jgi:hypothetical protein
VGKVEVEVESEEEEWERREVEKWEGEDCEGDGNPVHFSTPTVQRQQSLGAARPGPPAGSASVRPSFAQTHRVEEGRGEEDKAM